jgi:hypothetical protein
VFSFGKKNNNGIIDCSFLLKCIHRNILYLYILEGGGGGGFYSNGRSSTEFGGAYGVGGEEEVDSFRVEQVVVRSALKVPEDLKEVGMRTELVEVPAEVEDIAVELASVENVCNSCGGRRGTFNSGKNQVNKRRISS